MELRIGVTLDGQAVSFDTSMSRALVLVGDSGSGKTTIARYLARWWVADTSRHAHLVSSSPSEWADLRPETMPVGPGCRRGTCLVVVDDNDLATIEDITLPGTSTGIVTTSGGLGGLVLDDGVTSFGLTRNPANTRAAVVGVQGRLDWPDGTIPVIPDQRGRIDFPCHRWQTPVTSAAGGVWAVAR